MKRPALFLDRDGVINVNHGYVHKTENFDFIEGIFELVIAANNAGYLVIVVTNQAGIGRGYYSEEDFHTLTMWMKGEFRNKGGIIDAVYFSPYHPEHGIGVYKKDSDCRKPKPGMLHQAQLDFDIDMRKSILVGDMPSDIEAGCSAGVGTLLYLSGKADVKNSFTIKQLSQVLHYFSEKT